MDAVLADWQTAALPARSRAALRLLEVMTKRPSQLDASFIAELRTAGLEEDAMRAAANVAFHFNMLNRLSDAFGFETLTPRQEAVHTKILNQTGRFLRGRQINPISVRDPDGQVRPTALSRARRTLLSAPGKTTPELRRAVEAFVVNARGHERSGETIPEPLAPYLQKLALHAYKITEKDIRSLRENGYADEAIYEITVTGAFGAALVGVEKLFALGL